MILNIDAGNTRIKWLFQQGDSTPWSGALVSINEAVAHLVDNMLATLPARPLRCRLSSVRSEPFTAALIEALERALCLSVEYPTGSATCQKPVLRHLGCDRWMSILATRALFPHKTMLIADVGTALTLEVINAHGALEGSFIVPGLRVMVEGLSHATDKIALPMPFENDFTSSCLGQDTLSSMRNGALAAIIALIERQAAGARAEVVLTGGDGALLARHISAKYYYEPHLVMKGLAIALP